MQVPWALVQSSPKHCPSSRGFKQGDNPGFNKPTSQMAASALAFSAVKKREVPSLYSTCVGRGWEKRRYRGYPVAGGHVTLWCTERGVQPSKCSRMQARVPPASP